jgi:thiosulfate dehydrogenase
MAWCWFPPLRHHRDLALGFVLLALAGTGSGCGGDRDVPAAQLGARLFTSPALSTSRFNRFACSTCHTIAAGAGPVVPGRWDSGYNLHGVAGRPTWWGGASLRLLDAVNDCIELFMGGRRLSAAEPQALQLGAYLAESSPPDPQPAAPLTVVRVATPLADLAGDANRGALIYAASCFRCHGAPHSGSGRLDPSVSILPEDTLHFFPTNGRAAFVEKIRHGRFFNIGGVMPFYSLEAMSDADVADILAFVGL